MKETQCWTWRFSPEGLLQYGQCMSTSQWRQQRADGWAQITPTGVAKRLHLLATVYQQPNLFLVYRARHPAPELAMEPEQFQALFKGVGAPLAYTPRVLSDIATAFMLPPSFLLLQRVVVVPRPFDGGARRWDRMSSVRPTGTGDTESALRARAKPSPGVVWESLGAGELASEVEITTQEGEPFLFLRRTPRLYAVTYRLDNDCCMFLIVETAKKRAEDAFAAAFPEGEIISTVSSLALPGLAINVTLSD
jgi:hypothetical protein